MSKSIAGVVASLIFAVITVGGFYWLWTTSNSEAIPTEAASSGSSEIVEIESVKKEAQDILSGLEKNSDIPLTTPTDKMGRANPFSAY